MVKVMLSIIREASENEKKSLLNPIQYVSQCIPIQTIIRGPGHFGLMIHTLAHELADPGEMKTHVHRKSSNYA